MSLTLLLGFSSIAGLLVGFLSARLGPRWLFPAFLGISVIVALCVWLWSIFGPVVDPFMVVMIIVGIVGPFVGCLLVAGLIGLVARRIATSSEAE